MLHGCAHGAPTSGFIVDKKELEPLPWYEKVWDRMEECAGPHARDSLDFAKIEFYSTSFMVSKEGTVLAGFWKSPHQIILADEYVNDPYTVGHEMGHELFGLSYPHESPEFSRCDWLAIQIRTEYLLGLLTHYEK